MRQPQTRSTLRWCLIAALLIVIDISAALWLVAALFIGVSGVGNGPPTAYSTYYRMLDDSYVLTTVDFTTGKTIRREVIDPATAAGLCRVWCPPLAASLLTLLGLAIASTRRGRRFVADVPLPRLTTRRLMIAVAAIGADLGLIIRTPLSSWGGLLYGQWTPNLVDLFFLHALAFMAVGVALLVDRIRRNGSQKKRDFFIF